MAKYMLIMSMKCFIYCIMCISMACCGAFTRGFSTVHVDKMNNIFPRNFSILFPGNNNDEQSSLTNKKQHNNQEIADKNKRSVSPRSTFDVEMWQLGHEKSTTFKDTLPDNTPLKKTLEEFPCPEKLCGPIKWDGGDVTFSPVKESFQASNSGGNISTTTTTPFFSASLPEIIAICILSGFASLITVAGNVLVIASFAINKSLRIVNNYLILSLAAADLLIGTISMNLFTILIVHGEWRLGVAVCDFWLTLDYVASNASVMNLFIICLDRYFSVTKPVKYRNTRTRKRFLMAIAGAWIISFVLWAPWIIGWQYIVNDRSVPEGQCYIQFIKDSKAVTVITAIGAFYLPAGAMCVLYWQVYQGIKNSRKKILRMKDATNDDSTKSTSEDEHGDDVILSSGRKSKVARWHRMICCIPPKRRKSKSNDRRNRQIFTVNNICLDTVLCCFNKSATMSSNVKECKNVDASNQAFIKSEYTAKDIEKEYDECDHQDASIYHEPDFTVNNDATSNSNLQNLNEKHEPFHYSKESIPFIEGDGSPLTNNKYNPPIDDTEKVNSDFYKGLEQSLKTSSRKLPGNPTDKRMKEYALPTRAVRRLPNIPRESKITESDDSKLVPIPRHIWQDGNESGNMRHACSEPYLNPEEKRTIRADSPTLPSLINRVSSARTTYTMVHDDQQECPKDPHTMNEAAFTYQEEEADTFLHTTITTVDSSDPPMSTAVSTTATPNLSGTKAEKAIVFMSRSPKSDPNSSNPPAIAKVGDKLKTQVVKKKLQSLKKETKAARLLASILAAFIILWTPYNVLVLVEAFCSEGETCIPDILWYIGYWLCYLNSTLNPVCYAMCNTSFRRTFKVILSMKWLDKRQRRMMNRPNINL